MTELLTKFPRWQQSAEESEPTTKVRYLSETATTNMAVKSVDTRNQKCAPITVSKLS